MKRATPRIHPCAALVCVVALAAGASPVAAREAPVPDIRAGQSLAEALQAYRAAGLPLAWSSNLVRADMKVLAGPGTPRPEPALRELLAPHGLALQRADGILLVVRSRGPPAALDPPAAGLLLIVRDERARPVASALGVTVDPQLPAPEVLGQGVLRFAPAVPGRYRLEIRVAGYLPVRREVSIPPGERVSLSVKLDAGPAELEDLTVSASRYLLLSNSQFFIDQRALQALPDVGDDPLRSVHRLPGVAAGGWSALSHFRGGEENETAIYLNGLRLLDPFHVRDFHNVFSAIDARAVAGVETWTGGFPVSYGDRMSGVVLLQTRRPDRPRRSEIGLSVFNTSLLSAGYSEDARWDWLASARRSNLEWVLDRQKHGQPAYYDLFAEVGLNLDGGTRVSANALHASDSVLVVTEHKPEESERSTSDTLNQSLWLVVDHPFTPELESRTVLSHTRFDNQRHALADDPEQLVAQVLDDRDVTLLGLRQDWTLDRGNRLQWRWGWSLESARSRYRYVSQADYAGVYLLYPDVPAQLRRDIRAGPRGEAGSLYLAGRLPLGQATTLEAGLRWDRQSWRTPAAGGRLSPRLNLLHTASERLELRLAWGSYLQPQGIHELQVEDGETAFFRPQEARHAIAGLRYRPSPSWSIRMEAFAKHYDHLRPRYENLLDPLPLIPELQPDRVRVAPASAVVRGLELTVEYERGPGLRGWASYTLARARDRIGVRYEHRNWDQRHSLQAGLAWQTARWEFGLAARAHSGWPTTSAALAGVPGDYRLEFGPRNAERLNRFASLDLRVARSWQLSRGQLTAFAEVSNLTNRQNECCVDYDIDFDDDSEVGDLERSVDHWLGVTPAVGILWEF